MVERRNACRGSVPTEISCRELAESSSLPPQSPKDGAPFTERILTRHSHVAERRGVASRSIGAGNFKKASQETG